jgi:hypothetical protein
LRWCRKRHGERSCFTEEHVVAADCLRIAFDGAAIGFSGLKDWRPIASIHYRPMSGHRLTALKQLRSRNAFDRTWALLDPTARLLAMLIILQNRSCASVAKQIEWSAPMVVAAIVDVLDRLCTHWNIRPGRQAA